jgi:hypothetical protein
MSEDKTRIAGLQHASHWRFLAIAGIALLALMLLARHSGRSR